jgi:hypothetical protein
MQSHIEAVVWPVILHMEYCMDMKLQHIYDLIITTLTQLANRILIKKEASIELSTQICNNMEILCT